AGQSSESVNSNAYGGDSSSSRMMPRGTHTTDEELVFRNDSSRSKSSQNHNYMASISTGQKVRSTMSASASRVGPPSANSSSTNVSQQVSQRSASSTGHYPGGGGSPGSSARSSAVRLPARASPGAGDGGGGGGGGAGKRRPAVQQGHQRKPSIDSRGYLRALNDLFFAKFCVDELFYREFRELLVKRIQDSTYRYDPEDLQDILDDLSEACKSTRQVSHAAKLISPTRLNLDAVSQWRLNYFTRDQSASVIDHIFLINVNVMVYDPKYSNSCLDTYCADPLCSEIHAGRVTEEDKAKAFRRVLNIVLNEALRVRLITKDQKTAVRMRLVKGV
ncbi:hypothetical protein IWW38_004657, partial [Coemansia aciculifera]